MPALRVLISGGGIAGPALALPLARLGHRVTIVERSATHRSGGQQVDIREPAIEAVTRLGLIEDFRNIIVEEGGLQFVDTNDKVKAFFGGGGQERLSLSAEFELMRGQIAALLREKSEGLVAWKFGAVVEDWEDNGNTVQVKLSDGTEEEYDLLVAADGQNSKLRKVMLQRAGLADHTKSLEVLGGYFSIPREPSDKAVATVYNAVGGHVYSTRYHSKDQGQGYLLTMAKDERFRQTMREGSTQEKKAVLTEIFSDRGWQSNRLVKAMNETDDFYGTETVQIKSDKWSSGRVVLLGDAGYCPSPLTGMGTSLALIGAYVLAGEVGPADRKDQDLRRSLEAYESKLRPFVDKVQELPPGVPQMLYPETKWGIWILQTFAGVAAMLNVEKYASKLLPTSKNPWRLPDYPELDAAMKAGTV